MTHLFRVLYRAGNNSAEFEVHTGRKGTRFYVSPGAAQSAITQFEKQDRYYGGGVVEYKIQSAPIGEWSDLDA